MTWYLVVIATTSCLAGVVAGARGYSFTAFFIRGATFSPLAVIWAATLRPDSRGRD